IAFEPKHRYNLLDDAATWLASDAFDWAFLDSIAQGKIRFRAPGFPNLDEPLADLVPLDFIGINYYRRDIVSFAPGEPGLLKNEPGDGMRSDLDWELYPQGLLFSIREVHNRYRRPIYVTENGIADTKGAHRATFIKNHLAAVAAAIGEGIDVRGYFYWSFLDN